MYDLQTWMQEIETEARSKGLKPIDFCKLAGIHRSVWSHMKRRDDAKLSTLNKIEQAIRGKNA